ncbi:hypothetical protein RhiJN_28988 [Ceratobasidium sp. AG-Ba]|nr:hypothetical protein RhiJN_28988 [Ceratobasidium sp. AG-Ba]
MRFAVTDDQLRSNCWTPERWVVRHPNGHEELMSKDSLTPPIHNAFHDMWEQNTGSSFVPGRPENTTRQGVDDTPTVQHPSSVSSRDIEMWDANQSVPPVEPLSSIESFGAITNGNSDGGVPVPTGPTRTLDLAEVTPGGPGLTNCTTRSGEVLAARVQKLLSYRKTLSTPEPHQNLSDKTPLSACETSPAKSIKATGSYYLYNPQDHAECRI